MSTLLCYFYFNWTRVIVYLTAYNSFNRNNLTGNYNNTYETEKE